jgi:hypothetical protein
MPREGREIGEGYERNREKQKEIGIDKQGRARAVAVALIATEATSNSKCI